MADVTITLDLDHLEAILENCEWSLRFAEAFERGDPLKDVPLWPTVEKVRVELGLPDDPLGPQPFEDYIAMLVGDRVLGGAASVDALIDELRQRVADLNRQLAEARRESER
jgi:hypothetical protein